MEVGSVFDSDSSSESNFLPQRRRGVVAYGRKPDNRFLKPNKVTVEPIELTVVDCC
jgi:hypothetical protein